MNTCASRVLLKPQKGETTLFITDMTKANVSLPRKIKWDEVTLPERWVMDKATPSIPRPAPTIEHIKQDNSGKIEIIFNRRNSFSSRIEASRSEYESAKSIDKETLRKDFYSPENEPQRRWFFQHYKVKDGELIQSELPPTTQYQLPNIKDSNNKPVMAIPFKTKDVNEEVTSKDIKSLMEQANYTNKYLQALGETIKTKVVPKQKSIEEASPSIPIEKPLFKPFKVSEKAKRKIRELRKTKSLIEGVGDNHSELLNKIGSLLKVIPDTPQASENTSKMVTRSTSKLINIINEDSDQNSDNTTEIGSVSEKNINPINSKHWKTPSKLYYQRPTAPDLLLEERGENNFKSFSANNIYEWNIDAQTEYNIMNTLQHMTMVATAYQTSHECSEETIIDILVAGFSGQLKGWWDNYLTNEEKSKIYSAVKTDLNGKVITNDDDKEIPNAVNTLIFTIAQHFIGDPSLWKDRSAELLSNLKCRTLADFRWYSDTFLTRVYTREDSHIRKYCRQQKKLRNLNLEPAIEEQINNLLIETSKEETETSSSVLSDENLNLIQQDDQLSSTDDDDGQINTLTREQDLLFEAINSIPDPQEKKVFLEKLKKTLEVKPRQKDFITNNKFDVSNILKRLENSSTKPTTIQDLQTEINNLKREIKELRQQQEIHQIILSQLEEDSDSESANNSEENQPENLEDDMFMGLINKIKIQKFYINIKIIINDFVLETMALFDTGADSNCILEGLIPTKFFEKTSEKLSTANGSKLKINFKLSNAIIENQGLKINTNFLLVKNLKNEVILGTPFIRALFPIQISNEGIITNYLGRKIIFNFSTKPISRNINLIENKINQINFLKEEVSFNNI
ncbi:hypothetical protein GYH30_009661 [Glycine max]|uniref:Uncharacterized protein n=1 Tax=Glycine max TaxID=3847 RepID=K7KJK4_SOYBN|nr:hypothetical protein JHK86_009778 [Glycine max]KAH1110961.1 hypothetical protein GYH30_009661 [Glycine max]